MMSRNLWMAVWLWVHGGLAPAVRRMQCAIIMPNGGFIMNRPRTVNKRMAGVTRRAAAAFMAGCHPPYGACHAPSSCQMVS